jgi:hypothetical protein
MKDRTRRKAKPGGASLTLPSNVHSTFISSGTSPQQEDAPAPLIFRLVRSALPRILQLPQRQLCSYRGRTSSHCAVRQESAGGYLGEIKWSSDI